MVEVQESTVGPRHFPVKDPRLLPPPEVLRRGDRVVLLSKTTSIPVPSSSPLTGQPPSTPVPGCQMPAHYTTAGGAAGSADGQASACRSVGGVLHEPLHESTSSNGSSLSPRTIDGSTCVNRITSGERLLFGQNELDAGQLLCLSAAYRRAGNANGLPACPLWTTHAAGAETVHCPSCRHARTSGRAMSLHLCLQVSSLTAESPQFHKPQQQLSRRHQLRKQTRDKAHPNRLQRGHTRQCPWRRRHAVPVPKQRL